MKPQVKFPDAERRTKDLLAVLVAPHEPTVTVGIGVPTNWTSDSEPHLQVALDGTPIVVRSVIAHATIRVTAWAASTSRAKEVALLAEGLLLAHTGGDGIAAIRPLTSVFPARDPDNRGELASITVRASVRSIPI